MSNLYRYGQKWERDELFEQINRLKATIAELCETIAGLRQEIERMKSATVSPSK